MATVTRRGPWMTRLLRMSPSVRAGTGVGLVSAWSSYFTTSPEASGLVYESATAAAGTSTAIVVMIARAPGADRCHRVSRQSVQQVGHPPQLIRPPPRRGVHGCGPVV